MRKVQLEQGSPEWLEWRKGRLTATDAAMLLGASPYVTPYQGWQRKLGLVPEQATNSAMLRGRRDEPIARAMFIEEYGINMIPCCIESDQHNFLGASLDGISDCGRYLLEVKSQDIDRIKSLGIPDFHMAQMQHALLCTDQSAEKCFYSTIWNSSIYTLEVNPDLDWMKNYLEKAHEFWKAVIFRESPPLTNKDYKKMNATDVWQGYAEEYKKVCEQIKTLEELKDSYRQQIISMCGDENCMGGGIKVMKKTTRGRVDYEAIPELSTVNLDMYRKEPTCSWVITVDKK